MSLRASLRWVNINYIQGGKHKKLHPKEGRLKVVWACGKNVGHRGRRMGEDRWVKKCMEIAVEGHRGRPHEHDDDDEQRRSLANA